LPGYLGFQHDWVLPVAELQFGTAGAFLMTLGLRLTGEERERSRMRAVFGRYVSDEVVDVLLQEDHRPDLGGEALQEERRQRQHRQHASDGCGVQRHGRERLRECGAGLSRRGQRIR
jgi:hypothetical protein